MEQREADLASLLTAAVPRGPMALRSQQAAGAALALALHSLMVQDGYQALDLAGRRIKGATPPEEWNTGEHVWAFTYERLGAARRFRLQLALQAATRRMFIHACELDGKGEPLQDNIQVMGVQLDRYVPAGDEVYSKISGRWQGVIASEQALVDMFEEFVLRPLWRNADKAADGGAPGSSGSSWQLGTLVRERRREALAAATVLTAVAVGVLLWRHRSAVARGDL